MLFSAGKGKGDLRQIRHAHGIGDRLAHMFASSAQQGIADVDVLFIRVAAIGCRDAGLGELMDIVAIIAETGKIIDVQQFRRARVP